MLATHPAHFSPFFMKILQFMSPRDCRLDFRRLLGPVECGLIFPEQRLVIEPRETEHAEHATKHRTPPKPFWSSFYSRWPRDLDLRWMQRQRIERKALLGIYFSSYCGGNSFSFKVGYRSPKERQFLTCNE